MTIPTDAGPQQVRVPYTSINYAGPQGVHATPGLPGGFVFAPIQGDCVTAPITKAVTQEFGVLTT